MFGSWPAMVCWSGWNNGNSFVMSLLRAKPASGGNAVARRMAEFRIFGELSESYRAALIQPSYIIYLNHEPEAAAGGE